MDSALKPLSDPDLRRFLRDGFVPVVADFDEPVHARVYERLVTVCETQRNPGNNLLPLVPEIARVYDHPAVRGALTRILGPGYRMHGHRHGHLNRPGTPAQDWHKDSYVYDPAIRHPRPRFVLALYYPQDVTLDMGPTGLMPGRHYVPDVSDPRLDHSTEASLGVCGPAGTVAIVHNDAWHCKMVNTSANRRFMLKFLFERGAEPVPDPDAAPWEPDPADPYDPVHADVWRWLHGQASPVRPWDPAEATALRPLLDQPDTAVALPAARALAGFGAAAVPLLVDTLAAQARAAADTFGAKSPGNPHGINPHALPASGALAMVGAPAVDALSELLADPNWCVRTVAADTLGDIGRASAPAVPALRRALDDPHPRVRRHAVEALGRTGDAGAAALPALIGRLRDPDTAVRLNAALALARLGLPADEAVAPLVLSLRDDDRYVRDVAGYALRCLGTPRATGALLDALSTARWCDLTSPDSTY